MRANDYKDVPSTVREIFENGEREYHFYTEDSLDNYWSMDRFLKLTNASEFIVLHDGTQVFLMHPDFPHNLQLDAGGLGDFYSHKITVKIDTHE
jgi:phage pi2 protein 07